MKILLLGDLFSVHMVKWAEGLAARGLTVAVFGLGGRPDTGFEGVEVHSLGVPRAVAGADGALPFGKLRYLAAVPRLRRLIRDFQPDIVHSHYATSYGLLGVLGGFHPLIISVWGDDVYIFPRISRWHRRLLRYNLRHCERLLSTSRAMADETAKYTDKTMDVTPFGVDLEVFKPMGKTVSVAGRPLTIGTVKSLDEIYGVDVLLEAYAIARGRLQADDMPTRLALVGDGAMEAKLRGRAAELGLESEVEFLGRVPHCDVPKHHNMMDIEVFLSNSESFGVSTIEAGACGVPVVVSDVGGLPEVVVDGVTGLVVPPRNPAAAAVAIEKLARDANLRKSMGDSARRRVANIYNWNDNLEHMLGIYRGLCPIFWVAALAALKYCCFFEVGLK